MDDIDRYFLQHSIILSLQFEVFSSVQVLLQFLQHVYTKSSKNMCLKTSLMLQLDSAGNSSKFTISWIFISLIWLASKNSLYGPVHFVMKFVNLRFWSWFYINSFFPLCLVFRWHQPKVSRFSPPRFAPANKLEALFSLKSVGRMTDHFMDFLVQIVWTFFSPTPLYRTKFVRILIQFPNILWLFLASKRRSEIDFKFCLLGKEMIYSLQK